MPKVSIITVNLNNLEGLQRTMKSVFNQSWQEFEYLVIDGGSSDGSLEFIERHQENLHYWISEPDTGIYDAMNKGIKEANGEYLLFLNSGDYLFNDYTLEKNHQILKDLDLVSFNLNHLTATGEEIREYPHKITFSYMVQDSLPHPATFIKSSLFKRVGLYDEGLKIVSDWKFFIIALGKYNATYKYVNTILTNFSLDGISSHSSNWPIIVKERQDVLKKEFCFFLEDYEAISQLEYKISTLRNAKKIKWLVRFGLLKRF